MAGKFRGGKYAKRKFKKRFKKKRFIRKNSKSIKRLAKTVYKLQRRERLNHAVMRFNVIRDGSNPAINGVDPGFTYIRLSDHGVNSSTPVFASSTATGTGMGAQAVMWKKVTMRLTFDIRQLLTVANTTNIFDPTQFTVAVVSPKDSTNVQSFVAGGTLNLQKSIDYVCNSAQSGAGLQTTGAHIMFNLARWRIHKMKTFTLGNMGSFPGTSTSLSEVRREFTWKIRPNILVRNTANAGGSAWNSMSFDPDPSKNMYLVVFSNGAPPSGGGDVTSKTGNFHWEFLHKYISIGP